MPGPILLADPAGWRNGAPASTFDRALRSYYTRALSGGQIPVTVTANGSRPGPERSVFRLPHEPSAREISGRLESVRVRVDDMQRMETGDDAVTADELRRVRHFLEYKLAELALKMRWGGVVHARVTFWRTAK